ncbi:hypothetical protein, partial [Argonema antarcticum]|uniref:hypothetical protein n=1 Tax=Argonema antarcticum TaxID=2942763 RepID=UPI0020125AE1
MASNSQRERNLPSLCFCINRRRILTAKYNIMFSRLIGILCHCAFDNQPIWDFGLICDRTQKFATLPLLIPGQPLILTQGKFQTQS